MVQRKEAEQQLDKAVAGAQSQPTQKERDEVRLARATVDAASLRVGAIGDAYTLSVQGQVSTRLIQVISPATVAVSDRRSTFIIYTVIGFIVGLLLGAGLAFFRESRFSADLNP